MDDVAGVGVLGDVDLLAVVDADGVGLGDGDEDAQAADLVEMEELVRLGGGAGVDEGADVGIARGDDAVERGDDALVALQLLEAADVGLLRGGGGFFGGEVAGDLVGLLHGDGVLGDERLPADVGGGGELLVGLRALEVGLSLLELLVEFGRLDGGEEFALMHVLADVGEPLLHVAVGARVDGGVDEGLGIAGEHDLLRFGAAGGMDDGDAGSRGSLGGGLQVLLGGGAGVDAVDDGGGEQDGDDDGEYPRGAAGFVGFGRTLSEPLLFRGVVRLGRGRGCGELRGPLGYRAIGHYAFHRSRLHPSILMRLCRLGFMRSGSPVWPSRGRRGATRCRG